MMYLYRPPRRLRLLPPPRLRPLSLLPPLLPSPHSRKLLALNLRSSLRLLLISPAARLSRRTRLPSPLPSAHPVPSVLPAGSAAPSRRIRTLASVLPALSAHRARSVQVDLAASPASLRSRRNSRRNSSRRRLRLLSKDPSVPPVPLRLLRPRKAMHRPRLLPPSLRRLLRP